MSACHCDCYVWRYWPYNTSGSRRQEVPAIQLFTTDPGSRRGWTTRCRLLTCVLPEQLGNNVEEAPC